MSWNTKEETSRRRVTTQQLLTWESMSPAESLGRMWDKGESIHHSCNSTSPRAERSSATPMKLVNSSLLLRPWMAKDSCIKMIKESWEMEFTLKQVVRSGQSLSGEWLPFKFFFFFYQLSLWVCPSILQWVHFEARGQLLGVVSLLPQWTQVIWLVQRSCLLTEPSHHLLFFW